MIEYLIIEIIKIVFICITIKSNSNIVLKGWKQQLKEICINFLYLSIGNLFQKLLFHIKLWVKWRNFWRNSYAHQLLIGKSTFFREILKTLTTSTYNILKIFEIFCIDSMSFSSQIKPMKIKIIFQKLQTKMRKYFTFALYS